MQYDSIVNDEMSSLIGYPSRLHFPGKILVPMDGSANSKRALEVGIRLAKVYDSVLVILNVISLPTSVRVANTSRYMALESYYEGKEREVSDFMEAAVASAKAKGISKVRSELAHAPKSIAHGINLFATRNKIDLIVIGTRGLGGFKKFVLGSVSSGVASQAPCNMLIVR